MSMKLKQIFIQQQTNDKKKLIKHINTHYSKIDVW